MIMILNGIFLTVAKLFCVVSDYSCAFNCGLYVLFCPGNFEMLSAIDVASPKFTLNSETPGQLRKMSVTSK
jgi:hypothetical protein